MSKLNFPQGHEVATIRQSSVPKVMGRDVWSQQRSRERKVRHSLLSGMCGSWLETASWSNWSRFALCCSWLELEPGGTILTGAGTVSCACAAIAESAQHAEGCESRWSRGRETLAVAETRRCVHSRKNSQRWLVSQSQQVDSCSNK